MKSGSTDNASETPNLRPRRRITTVMPDTSDTTSPHISNRDSTPSAPFSETGSTTVTRRRPGTSTKQHGATIRSFFSKLSQTDKPFSPATTPGRFQRTVPSPSTACATESTTTPALNFPDGRKTDSTIPHGTAPSSQPDPADCFSNRPLRPAASANFFP